VVQAVRFTFRHAQAAMLTVCCDQTVLIGHGLQNDLVRPMFPGFCPFPDCTGAMPSR
jgi:hypothetical protein